MTPQLRTERIETRRQLAAYARQHNWHTTEPVAGATWIVLELFHPQLRLRVVIRWTDDTTAATIMDYTREATWTWAEPTDRDLHWLAGNPDTIPAVVDLCRTRPTVINLRDIA